MLPAALSAGLSIRTIKDIDGLLFSSRLTGADVFAVFDRGITKLEAADAGMLPDHPDLPDVLSKYGITLIST